ncbi:hypothetical protein V6N11_036816 [Hibiscus sabdariffa]|uniref:Uncharacterized protein n=1 Tax=Hibiscus sabdariffa TaxID=183260 RepID=A0ABR2RBG5_9ROSI
MLPETEAMPALPISLFVRFKLSLMMGTRGAAAKVETKHVKNESQERWKVTIWGLANDKRLKTLALCSESTGSAKFAVGSVGILGEATEKAKACSFADTPCMELPGSFSVSPMINLERYSSV